MAYSKKSVVREYFESIVIAVILALFILLLKQWSEERLSRLKAAGDEE